MSWIVRIFLALVLLGGVGYVAHQRIAFFDRAQGAFAAFEPTVESALQSRRDAYRMKPDARFTRAIAEVHRLLTGERRADVETLPTKEGWRILHAGAEVAQLDDLADFAQQLAALVDWAHSLGARAGGGLDAAVADAFFVPAAFDSLHKIDQRWTGRDPDQADVLAASRLLTGILLQTRDDLERADPIAARAWAALAIARSISPGSGLVTETLLAHGLGYSSHAGTLARRLAPETAARAYVLREDAMLEQLASGGEAFDEARFLWLRRVAEKRSLDAWRAALGRINAPDRAVPALLLSGVRASFEASRWVPEIALPVIGVLILGENAAVGIEDPTDMIAKSEDIERAIHEQAQAFDGAFLDSAIYESHWNANWFSTVYQLFRFRMHQWSSLPASEAAVAKFSELAAGTTGQLRDWAVAELGVLQGKPDPEALLRIALEGSSLGSWQRQRSLANSWTAEKMYASNPAARQRIRKLAPTLDARPNHRARMAYKARTNLFDLPLAEALESSIERDDGFAHRRSLLLLDDASLSEAWAIADDREAPIDERVEALHRAAKLRGDISRRRTAWAELWERDPGNWQVFRGYTAVLGLEPEEPARIEELCRAYLQHREWHQGLRRSLAVEKLARVLREQGRLEEAWSVLEPEIQGQFGGVLEEATRVRIDAGDLRGAEKLAMFTRKRYPNVAWALGVHMELLWRQARPEQAALEARAFRSRLVTSQWDRFIASRFAKVYAGAEADVVLPAFDFLLRNNLRIGGFRRFTDIAKRFERLDRHDLAFEMYWRMTRINAAVFTTADADPLYHPRDTVPTDHDDRGLHLADAWRSLREWRGEAAAREWVRRVTPPVFANRVARYFYESGNSELLWDAFESPPTYTYFWLLRALAVALDPETDALHGDGVRDYFAEPGDSTSHTFGRTILGLEPEETLLATPLAEVDLVNTAFYLGVAAQSRGDLVSASDWYQVALETGEVTRAEYERASHQVVSWSKSRRPLAER